MNRLGEHFPANPRRWPALGRHMLVESLARADTQHESSFTLHCGGRRRLRHDGRVNPDQWARYRSGDRQRSRLTERADDRPHEGTVALFVKPGMEMVRNPQALESGLFGLLRQPHQFTRAELFTGQEIADTHHVFPIPGPKQRKH